MHQKRARRYEDVLSGKGRSSLSKEKVLQELAAAEQQAQQLKDAVEKLQQQQPKHARMWQNILAYM